MNETKKIVVRTRAVIVHEGKLLLVRHHHDTSFAALPGGNLEWGEGVKECLRRELVEELGAQPEIGRLLYVNTFIDRNNAQSVEFFFEVGNSGDYADLDGKERSHAHELVELFWAGPDDRVRILPEALQADFEAGDLLSDEVRFIKG